MTYSGDSKPAVLHSGQAVIETAEEALREAAQKIEFAAFELAAQLPSDQIGVLITMAHDLMSIAEDAGRL